MAQRREDVDLYLECTTSPFLNRYYQALGFHLIGRKVRIYKPDHAPFEMMRYRFGDREMELEMRTEERDN